MQVSLAMFLLRKLSWQRLLLFVFVQMAGSVSGTLILWGLVQKAVDYHFGINQLQNG
jgi:glycerol uptake facilitator-like aquaporin